MHFVIRYEGRLYLGPTVKGRQVYPSPQWLDRSDSLVCRFSSREAAAKHLGWVICRHPGQRSYCSARVIEVRKKDRVRDEREAIAAEVKRRWEQCGPQWTNSTFGPADAYGGIINWIAARSSPSSGEAKR